MYAVLSVLGLLAAWGAMAIDSESPFLRVLAGYTLVAVALTLALAVAAGLTRQLPTVHETTFEGRPARGVHGWGAEWWHTNALDLSLALGSFTLAALGIREGFDMRIPGIAVGVFGLWWFLRVLLSLTSRRNNSGFWLTSDEVVLESAEGRVRCARDAVLSVTHLGSHGLVVAIKGDARLERCPLPWRPRSTQFTQNIAVVSLEMTGHTASDVADWLSDELGLVASTPPLARN